MSVDMIALIAAYVLILGVLGLTILLNSMIKLTQERIDLLKSMHDARLDQLEDANDVIHAMLSRLDQPSLVPKQRRTMYPDQNV